ncbi:MAG: response regulator [Candidatus Marinimicrobia bacterium]|nr:response regulator [Candidatus Neomarinimicrobiota bacterium]
MATYNEKEYYPGRSKQVLIVDDKCEVREILNVVLTMYGYSCLEASNGNEAEVMYTSNHIDLVITDIYMPEKDGLSLIEELKVLDPDAKIIAMSGGDKFHNPACLDWAKALGAANTFVKPFNHVNFMNIVDSVINPKDQHQHVMPTRQESFALAY